MYIRTYIGIRPVVTKFTWLDAVASMSHVLNFDGLLFEGGHYLRGAFITLKHIACGYYSIQ